MLPLTLVSFLIVWPVILIVLGLLFLKIIFGF